jgi:uncharacterized membrane protein
VILVPGYLTVLFLFPAFVDIDLYKRIFLCLGSSALLAGLVSLVLWLTPRGLHPASLATILSLLAIFLAAISYIRWSTLPRKRGFVSRSRSKKSLRPAKSRSRILGAGIRDRRKALLLAFAAVCIVGAIALAVSMNLVSSSKGSTILEVSWPREALESQNVPLETGRELVVQARIINHEESSANYTLKLLLNNSSLDVRDLNVAQNETWQGRMGFMIVGGPGQQSLDLQLYREGDYSRPYREEHIEINITENIPQNYSGEPVQQTDTANSTMSDAAEKNPPAIMEEMSKVTVLSASGQGSISASSSVAGAQSPQSSQAVAQSQTTAKSAKESITASSIPASSIPASTSSSGTAFANPESETTSREIIAATPATQSAVEKASPNPGAWRNNSTIESTEPFSLPAPKIEKNATTPERSIPPESSLPEAISSAQAITPPESRESNQSTTSLNSNMPPELEDLKADEDSIDDSMNATITILAPNQPPVIKSLQPDKPSPQEKGAIVLWKALATDPDNDRIFYKFLLNGREAKKWSRSNSWSWPTENLPAGDYQITVLARDGNHAPDGSFDSSANTSFSLKNPEDPNRTPVLNDLKPDMNSPQARGTAITWTASATDQDGDGVYYKFLANDNEVTDWSPSNYWNWDTSTYPPGDYKIRVLARDGQHSGTDSFDSEIEVAFTLTPSSQIQAASSNQKASNQTASSNQIPLVQELRPDMASPQTVGAVITWTADATDPDGDRVYYKFLVDGKEVTDWSRSNSWIWNTSAALSGDYSIRVLARDDHHESEDSFDSSREANFLLQATNQPPILRSLEPDRSSPQVQGAVVLWKAGAHDTDGDPILYKFQVNGRDMSRWSESGNWSWSTRNLAAEDYRIRVLARDGRHAAEDSFDSSQSATFALTTEIDHQIDQLMSQRGMGTSGEKSYHSSDIRVAIANGTDTKAVLGKSGESDLSLLST